MLVSVFTPARTTVLFTIGPFDATLEGVDFAAQTLVRLFAISTAIGPAHLSARVRAVLDTLKAERVG